MCENTGFPDTFKIVVSDTQAYQQFGNSVVVPLMTDVAGLIVSKMKEMEGRKRNECCVTGDTSGYEWATDVYKISHCK